MDARRYWSTHPGTYGFLDNLAREFLDSGIEDPGPTIIVRRGSQIVNLIAGNYIDSAYSICVGPKVGPNFVVHNASYLHRYNDVDEIVAVNRRGPENFITTHLQPWHVTNVDNIFAQKEPTEETAASSAYFTVNSVLPKRQIHGYQYRVNPYLRLTAACMPNFTLWTIGQVLLTRHKWLAFRSWCKFNPFFRVELDDPRTSTTISYDWNTNLLSAAVLRGITPNIAAGFSCAYNLSSNKWEGSVGARYRCVEVGKPITEASIIADTVGGMRMSVLREVAPDFFLAGELSTIHWGEFNKAQIVGLLKFKQPKVGATGPALLRFNVTSDAEVGLMYATMHKDSRWFGIGVSYCPMRPGRKFGLSLYLSL